jgi:molybdate transport system substrate-binding protein
MKNDAARAKFAGTPAPVTRVGYGVAVRARAPKPDVSTPDALKRALLNAQSVTFLPDSAAGAHVLKVFERLGIANTMKGKIKAQTVPAKIPEAVANGEAELGVFLTNVLIGRASTRRPFPSRFAAGLCPGRRRRGRHADAARAFLDYLKTPDAAAVFRAKGVTPG